MRSCQASAGVAMSLAASSSSVVKKSRHKRPPGAAPTAGCHSQVRPRLARCAGLVLALASVLLLALVATSPLGLVGAKMHHSKRQAPITSFASPTTPSMAPTGRENTNWWNVWWQQYIDEAEQPTVRPIVGLTFNGRTINLADQSARSADEEESVSAGNVDSANSIGDSSPPFDRPPDLERSARSQPEGSGQQAGPSGSARSAKSMQQQVQGNWQNVRPTMLQPKAAATMRDLRPSRQTEQQQREDEQPAQLQLGIQMRNSMNAQKRRPQQQQQPASQLLLPPQPQLQQQQQPRWRQRQQQQQQLLQQMPIEFEQQQQNQMVDYSEDGEPELEGGQPEGDQPRASTARDSSSSSMMASEQPDAEKAATSTTVRPAQAGGANADQPRPATAAAAAGAVEMRWPQQQPAQKGQPMILIPGKRPASAPKQPVASPAAATTARVAPASTAAPAAAGGEQSSPTTETPTSTAAAASGTTAQPTTTTVDLNETPISLGEAEQQAPSQQPSTTMTTPGGRIALENGRPASRQQPQATTTSARLPTGKSLTKTTPTQASTASMGSSTEATTAAPTLAPGASVSPTTTTQATADSSAPTTTSTSVGSSMTTTDSPAPTTAAPGVPRVPAAGERQTGQPVAPVTSTTMMTPTATAGGGATAAGETSETDAEEAEGDSGEDDEEETEEEQPSTSTSKPTTARLQLGSTSQMSPSPTSAATTGAASSTPAAQQSSMATMDLERLPKGPSGTTSVDGTSRMARPAAAAARPAPSERPKSLDATRDEFGSMFMPEQASRTTPTVVSGDTPITMPMDQLMRMMMGGQTTTPAQEAGPETSPRTSAESDAGRMPTTPAAATSQQQQQLQTTTTTAQTPTGGSSAAEQATGAPRGSSTSFTPTTTTSSSMQAELEGGPSSAGTESSSATTPSGAMIDLARMVEQESVAANEMTGSPVAAGSGRKKLQPPPPTTRAPGADQTVPTSQQQREREQPAGAPPPAGGAGAGSSPLTTERPGLPTSTTAQRTVMVSLDQRQPGPTAPAGAGGEEAKIELLNLDLMPIQRMMSQQQQPTKTSAKLDRLNMVGVQALPGRQKPKQQPAVEPTFTEVEPGMRLRPVGAQVQAPPPPPPKQQQQAAGMQVVPARVMGQQQPGDERANTVYMIMMSSPSPASASQQQQQQPQPQQQKTQKQKPATVIEMTQSPPGPPQMARAQTPAAKQRGQQVAGTKASSQAPPSRGPQQQPSSGLGTTGASTLTTSGQQRLSTPRAKTGQEMEREQQIMMMMSMLGALPTEPARAAAASTTSRPALMENAIEMEMQMGAISAQKDTVKMRKLNELDGARQMATESLAKSTLPAATASTTTTAQAAPATGAISGDQSSGVTTTSSPADTVRLSTTTTAAPATIKSSSGAQDTIGPAEALSTPPSSLPPMTAGPPTSEPFTTTTTSAAASPRGTTAAGVSSPSATEAPADQMTNQTPSSSIEEEGEPGAGAGGGAGTSAFGGRPALREGPAQAAGDNNQQQDGRSQQQFERYKQQQQQQQQQQPQQPVATSAAAAGNSRTTATGDRRHQQQQPAQTGVKSGRTGASKTSSSFIPSRLRTDFAPSPAAKLQLNRTQSQAAQSEQKPSARPMAAAAAAAAGISALEPMVQNMAIRQFGGANRMSVLANKPVAFGRPASVTVQSQSARLMQAQPQQQSRASNNRVEVPSFEYGPSIAVRRPDEPLANGQMPNCTLTGKNFCVLTKDYPMNEVRQAVERSFRSVRIMYEELQTVSDQDIHKDLINTNATNQAATGQFACQTQVEMMRPGWAKDEITKEWMLVVNTDVFPQRVRTESCAQPNTPCEFIAPFYDSTCQQRYSLHRMIAIDPHDPSRSPQVAMFRFPAGCVCRVHPIKKFFSSTTTSQQTTTTTPVPSTTSSQRSSA